MGHLSKRRWAGILLGVLCILLLLCAASVRLIDPFFHYHAPDPEGEVWFDQRGQGAGLLRTQEYETVLMGSSLAANYRAFWFDVLYDTATVKLTFPNGGFREFTRALDYACSQREVKRVIFGLDPNLLSRPRAEEPDCLPEYLYDGNPWNDGAYLLNKDVLSRSFYTLLKKSRGEAEPLQEAFVWDGSTAFGRAEALAGYDRPDPSGVKLPADAFRADYLLHLSEVSGWLEKYPDVEFIIFFAPYSILFWDRAERLGETDAVFGMLEEVTESLLKYDNAELHFFMGNLGVITDLDNYADHIHAAGRVTYRMAEAMKAGTYRMTEENRREMLDALREFVVQYDYNALYDHIS